MAGQQTKAKKEWKCAETHEQRMNEGQQPTTARERDIFKRSRTRIEEREKNKKKRKKEEKNRD